MKPVTSRHISEKYSNIKFHENPPTWSRVVHADGLLVAFGNFSNAQVREFVSMQFTTEVLEAAHQNFAFWNYSNGVYPSTQLHVHLTPLVGRHQQILTPLIARHQYKLPLLVGRNQQKLASSSNPYGSDAPRPCGPLCLII